MAVLSVLEPSRQQAPSIVDAFQEVNPLTAMSFGIESAINNILRGLEQRDDLAAERERQEELAAQRLAQQAQAQIEELQLVQPSTSQQQHLDLALEATWDRLHTVDTVTGMQLLEEVKEDLYLSQTASQYTEVPQFEDSSSIIGGSRLDPYEGTLTFAALPETEARSWRDPEAPLPPTAPRDSQELMTMTFAAQGAEPEVVPFVEAPSPTQLDEIRARGVENEPYSTMSLAVVDFSGSSQDWRQNYFESRTAA